MFPSGRLGSLAGLASGNFGFWREWIFKLGNGVLLKSPSAEMPKEIRSKGNYYRIAPSKCNYLLNALKDLRI